MGTTMYTLATQLSDQQRDVKSEGRIMCEEVAHAINEAYTDGQIREADARAIIDRCFALIENP